MTSPLFLVGKPIHVTKCDKPTLEEVMRVQQKYIEELTRFVFPLLFNAGLIDDIWCAGYGTHTKTHSPRRV